MDASVVSDFLDKHGLATFMVMILMAQQWYLLRMLVRNVERLSVLMAVHLRLEEQAKESDPRVSQILEGVITRKEKAQR